MQRYGDQNHQKLPALTILLLFEATFFRKDLRYFYQFRIYSRLKSNVVRNSLKFCTFWLPFLKLQILEHNLQNLTLFYIHIIWQNSIAIG